MLNITSAIFSGDGTVIKISLSLGFVLSSLPEGKIGCDEYLQFKDAEKYLCSWSKDDMDVIESFGAEEGSNENDVVIVSNILIIHEAYKTSCSVCLTSHPRVFSRICS
jgi:hypothetical protein